MVNVIESATFKRWIRDLRDRIAVARINARLRNGWRRTGRKHD